MSSLIANAFTDSGRVIGYSGTGKKQVRRHAVRNPTMRLLVAPMGGRRKTYRRRRHLF